MILSAKVQQIADNTKKKVNFCKFTFLYLVFTIIIHCSPNKQAYNLRTLLFGIPSTNCSPRVPFIVNMP